MIATRKSVAWWLACLRGRAIVVTWGTLALLGSVGACGGGTVVQVDGSADGSFPRPTDASNDVTALLCGDAACSASEICLYPCCHVPMEPATDAGACPDGFGYSDARDSCYLPTSCPPPSCVPVPEAGTFDCSGEDAGTGCSFVSPPFPSGCSRACRATCE
jgi:hypothetical protein